MKKTTARTIMMKRIAGLILLPDDGIGGDGDESFWYEGML